jgi:hypothetical protein
VEPYIFITRAKIIVPIINGDLFAREDVRLSDNLDLPRPWHCKDVLDMFLEAMVIS